MRIGRWVWWVTRWEATRWCSLPKNTTLNRSRDVSIGSFWLITQPILLANWFRLCKQERCWLNWQLSTSIDRWVRSISRLRSCQWVQPYRRCWKMKWCNVRVGIDGDPICLCWLVVHSNRLGSMIWQLTILVDGKHRWRSSMAGIRVNSVRSNWRNTVCSILSSQLRSAIELSMRAIGCISIILRCSLLRCLNYYRHESTTI